MDRIRRCAAALLAIAPSLGQNLRQIQTGLDMSSPMERDVALEQLLATATFAGAVRSQALLRFLAQRAWVDGDTSVNEIVIALDHLGRDASRFDPKNDSVVRVELSRLRKRIETCFANELADAPWRICVPAGSYAPLFLLRDTSPAVADASNALSVTKVTGEAASVAADATATPKQAVASLAPWWRRALSPVAAATLLSLVAVVAGVAYWLHAKDRVDPGDVVAVLPLTCSDEPSEVLFCDGLADEVLDRLVQVPELKVIARTSSFKFKGQAIDARDAGRQLGAKYLVEGSLQRESDRYKLVAQMVRTSDGAHVVSRVFQRTGSERLRLQSDFAELVADALALHLRPAFAHAKTDRDQLSPEALEKWQSAWRLVGGGNEPDQNKAMLLLDDVIATHPAFARAWATKASLIRNRAYFGESLEAAAAKALPPMRKAAELAPDDPGIQATLAFLEFMNRTDIRLVYARLKTLAERNPNHATVLYWWGTVLWLTGRLPEAADAYQASHVLSPFGTSPLHMRARMLAGIGGKDNLAEALRVVQQALAIDPNFTDLYRVRGQIRLMQGDYAAGKADLLRGIAPLGPVVNALSKAYFDRIEQRGGGQNSTGTGQSEALSDVLRLRAELVSKYGPGAMPFAASSALATGQPEEAIGWAQKAVAAGDDGIAHLAHELHDSAFIAIRDDPRMQAVYERIGSSWAKAPAVTTARVSQRP